ncbi:hypothetical protein FJZ18_03905 [Candidatus Pacearchaeota archaeon]|nr:hypothetical protein [Candidatus Pacearchaeota archaeon]
MAYRCVHCSSTYKDGAQEVLNGCSNCKRKFFFYIKEDKLKLISSNMAHPSIPGNNSAEDLVLNLSTGEKKQIEEDIRDITGIKDEEQPVFLDFESIRVLKPGKYLLDLQKLLSKERPRVYQLEDGKYIVDLSSIFGGEKKEARV